jgi:hypothetical protein
LFSVSCFPGFVGPANNKKIQPVVEKKIQPQVEAPSAKLQATQPVVVWISKRKI